jgi:predicted metalloprotease with PDZ domain
MPRMSNPAIIFDLCFAHAAQHLIDVTATYPAAYGEPLPHGDGRLVTVMMPAWAPGSYMIRDYARQVEAVRAYVPGHEEVALPVVKISKNQWQVRVATQEPVVLRYQVYGREMTVRSNVVTQDFALVQGSATYLTPCAHGHVPHTVRVTPPSHWQQVLGGLPIDVTDGVHCFTAPSFDVLVDSPFLAGNPKVDTFVTDGIPHALATVGGDGLFDNTRAAQDLHKLVKAAQAVWGQLPYPNYTMINLLHGGRGGLEHKQSSVIMGSPWAMRTGASYTDFLGLMAHEQFHAWNIKTLRPKALGPFDYHKENYTPSLWEAEGLTAYYDNLIVRRAKLTDDKTYLAQLAKDISTLWATYGRHVQSVAEASFDAWIKFYRRDENTDNITVSYYLKGSLIGLLLDAQLRLHSDNAVTLDDVMRAALGLYGGAAGFTEAEFRDVVAQACPAMDLAWLHEAIDTTQELDFTPVWQAFGIVCGRSEQAKQGKASVAVGIVAKEEAGRLMVSQVHRGQAAYLAGVQVDDEILAVDGYRTTLAAWSAWLEGAEAQVPATLLVARYGQLRQIDVTPQLRVDHSIQLTWDPQATAKQVACRTAWLQPRT